MLQQLLLNGIIAGGIYSLVALGFALIYQTTRFPARTMAGWFSAFANNASADRHFPKGQVASYGDSL